MTLDIREIGVRYANGTIGLESLSVVVAEGEVVAVVGESGSGKTTLLRAVLGLLPDGSRTFGEVLVEGRPVLGMRPQSSRRLRGPVVGYVAQDPFGSADPVWPVGHHVAAAWYAHGRRPSEGEQVRRLRTLGLSNAAYWMRRRPSAWSGGMLQRADLVAGTAHDPAVVLADEPTSALDADLAAAALEVLVREARSLVVASHDLSLVARYADRILVLRFGQVVEEVEVGRGGVEVLRRDARHPYTKELLSALARPSRASRAEPGPVVAQLQGLTLGYPRNPPVVRELGLDVRAGEIIGLLGPSGSGKTTVLRALAGILRPRSGAVRLAGTDIWSTRHLVPPRSGYVMPVFQDTTASLDPRWPIWRTVAEGLAGNARLTVALKPPATKLLCELGLEDVDPDERPLRLSGGQRQRVAIARALAAAPALLLADEPTAQLDPIVAADVLTVLTRLTGRGLALVIASHDEARLRSLADRTFRVQDGRLVQEPGSAAAVSKTSGNRSEGQLGAGDHQPGTPT
ncbi:ABC transporter ATP-binding protein [Actinopolymorpha pittospori]|uniref:Peptide/nickel transport system ATP-binding protein n=1 Tax=Actinopolymorpha pittospori TaxID=648752 RepID=A0A927R5L2_9ACTN|nr:ATP-binding cassette domain-containing protein [Actinopolymorpha pittospori]MBE1603422.1 peptide/nickel transport system ATP-binding protein [Actinopolymorpha pittospori]